MSGAPLWAFAQTSTSRAYRNLRSGGPQSFGSGATKIAVLLETQSASFGSASAAVIDGIRAAHSREGQGVAVEVIPVSDTGEGIDALMNQLPGRGFSFVIGPLTRNGVNVMADRGSLPMPVLALNLPDADRRVSRNLIFFGLAIETEARQIARAAFDDAALRIPNRRPLSALVVNNSTPIGRRVYSSISETWRELGGVMVDPVETDGKSNADFRSVLDGASADVVFAALGPDALRSLKANLPKGKPLYSTSQANAVQPGLTLRVPELDGIRLVEMPWQLQPEHVAVMAYPKAPTLTHLDFQRLYALGIDAFRLSRELLANKERFELDGVTGRLRVDLAADARVDRVSVLAEYRNGVIVAIESR